MIIGCRVWNTARLDSDFTIAIKVADLAGFDSLRPNDPLLPIFALGPSASSCSDISVLEKNSSKNSDVHRRRGKGKKLRAMKIH
jgi:hypothetical protein